METVSRCPICAGASIRALGSIEGPARAPGEVFTLHRCSRCRLLFLNPRPTREEIARYYPPTYFRLARRTAGLSGLKALALKEWFGYPLEVAAPPWLGPSFRLLGRLLRGHLGRQIPRFKEGGKLLEIGCGDGEFLAFMAELGWNVQGLDPSPLAIDFIVRSYGFRAVVGFAEDLPYRDSEFDVVVLNHVLEHLHHPHRAVEELRRVLKPGGVVLITTPNGGGLGHRLFGRSWVSLDPPVHLMVHAPRSLERLLKDHGLEVVMLQAPATTGASVLRRSIGRRSRVWAESRWVSALSRLYEGLLLLLSLLGLKLGEELQLRAVRPGPAGPEAAPRDRR